MADLSVPVGAKARNLGRLLAAGLPVPPGFVIAADQVCTGASLLDRARALGPRLAVRSSALVEDRPGASAAGLFTSHIDVAAEDVVTACRAVRESAESPVVQTYLEAIAGRAEPVAMAVIIQRMAGRADGLRGVVYTRPTDPDRRGEDLVIIEATCADELLLASCSRLGPRRFVRERDQPWMTDQQLDTLVDLALAAEAAIASEGADVEWCIDSEGAPWLVQARPLPTRRRPVASQLPSELMAFSHQQPERTWHWDAAHNPDPLSPAQAGLVERVGDLSPVEMRVVGGYLYWSPRPGRGSEPELTDDQLRAMFADCTERMDRALVPAEGESPVAVAPALAVYRDVYAIYAGELGPAVAVARRRNRSRGEDERTSAVARALDQGDRQSVAALASAWDVAAPALKRPDGARARQPRAGHSEPLSIRDMIEIDDLYFFRAQAVVRTALLAAASKLGLADPDDIFFLPLDQVRFMSDQPEQADPIELAARAARARLQRQEQREITPPLAFRDGRPVPAPTARHAPGAWRGLAAAPGTARGRALRMADLGQLPEQPFGRVIVCASLTPATLIQISGASAIVCEHGGVLDHAAAIARELAIPSVVGLPGLMQSVTDGDELLVDGHTGVVVTLPPSS